MCNWCAIWPPAEMPDTVIRSVSIFIEGAGSDDTGEAATSAPVSKNLYMVIVS
jgi:hypothetical protein